MVKRAVFLDRDGVLVAPVNGAAPATLEEFNVFPGASRAVDRIKAAGFTVIVVTNQPDVGRGIISRKTLLRMHQTMKAYISGIDHIRVCLHPPEGACYCRKPRPGMLTDAAVMFGISLNDSFMVGDRWSDVAAGRAAGCKTILIGEERSREQLNGEVPNYTVPSIGAAADVILSLEADDNAAPGKRFESQNIR